jgi:hypothetical protein
MATFGKLGKKPPKKDPRTLMLSKYTLSPPPAACDWTKGVTSWGEMLNDNLGDCTCAAVGHGVQVASLNSPSGEITPPDSTIEQLYEKSCGYVPGDPNTDGGGVILDVLNYVRNNAPWKFKDPTENPHKHPYQLFAYADPNPNDITHVKQAIATFGMVDIGLDLPLTAQSQVGSVWDVVGNPKTDSNSLPGSWGGHCVIIPKYDGDILTCITWGALQRMTIAFWNAYVDESHALLFRHWVEQYGVDYPEMLVQLEADLEQVTN